MPDYVSSQAKPDTNTFEKPDGVQAVTNPIEIQHDDGDVGTLKLPPDSLTIILIEYGHDNAVV